MAVYFLYGEDDYSIDLKIEDMKAKLNPDFLSMSYKVLDNPAYPDLITALRTPPMMFGESLFVINIGKYFLSKDYNFDDSELSDIEDALNNNPEMLNIVFLTKIPQEDGKKIDTRRKLYKILSKFNIEDFQLIPTYKVAELTNCIKNIAKKKELVIKEDAAESLIEHIGNSLRQFDVELDKLKLIAYPENIVTKKMVEEISISNQDLFNLTEYIMKNRKDEALAELKKLTDKKHPLEILSAIQTMLRKWIIIKIKSADISSQELAKLTGMHEFVVKKTKEKLKNTSASELVKLKENLFEAECKIKKAESLDINSEVEIALIR